MNLPVPFSYNVIEPITAGWSIDRKYLLTLSDGRKALLRLSPIETQSQKTQMVTILSRCHKLPVPKVLDDGVSTDGKYYYTLFTWLEGKPLSECLARLPEDVQYRLGVEAGKTLRAIHSIPIDPPIVGWEEQYQKKLELTYVRYEKCGLTIECIDRLKETIQKFEHLLKDRPQAFQHGDYHVGNFLFSPDRHLAVIDFDRTSIGDPFEEFDRLIWSHQLSPLFASGQLHGYFHGDPPEQFFELLALYNARGAINGLAWAKSFGEDEVQTIRKNIDILLNEHDNFERIVPRWYISMDQLDRILGDMND